MRDEWLSEGLSLAIDTGTVTLGRRGWKNSESLQFVQIAPSPLYLTRLEYFHALLLDGDARSLLHYQLVQLAMRVPPALLALLGAVARDVAGASRRSRLIAHKASLLDEHRRPCKLSHALEGHVT